jgi:hypothetical protein
MTTSASPVRVPGFEYQRVDVDGVTINCAIRGSGPPLLLLHGFPQNHLTWRHVAPALAEERDRPAARSGRKHRARGDGGLHPLLP